MMPGRLGSPREFTEDRLSEEGSFQNKTYQPDDVKIFKTTLLARRFPALQELRDTEIMSVLSEDSRASGRSQALMKKTYPKTDFASTARPKVKPHMNPGWSPNHEKKMSDGRPAPFVYTCPSQAKAMCERHPRDAYALCQEPYGHDHRDMMEMKEEDFRKEHPGRRFCPSNAIEARVSIRNKAYINSADEETLQMEQMSIRSRAGANTAVFKETYRGRRGKMLI